MKDTPPVIERKFRHMLMKRSGEERLKMGCSMHATAQALAKASLSQQHPGARPAELKRLLFLHFYGTDFEAKERKRIASALAERSRHNEAQEPGKRTTRKPADLIDLAIVKSSGSAAVRDKTETYGKRVKKKATVLGKMTGEANPLNVLNGAKRLKRLERLEQLEPLERYFCQNGMSKKNSSP